VPQEHREFARHSEVNSEPISISLEAVPAASGPHLVADWLELVCLTDPDGEASLDRIVAARYPERDTGAPGAIEDSGLALTAALQQDEKAVEDREEAEHRANDLGVEDNGAELDAGAREDLLSLYFDDAPGASDSGKRPDLGDQPARELARVAPDAEPPKRPRSLTPRGTEERADLWTLLNDRRRVLGATYPFVLDPPKTLRLVDPLEPQHRMYLLLLLASSLGRLPAGTWSELTTAFERLGSYVLEGWLGGSYRVDVFGTAASSGDRYHGNLRVALERLGRDLNWPLHDEVKEELSSSGDRGLDVVAWRPRNPDDAADLWVTYFAQCGCGKEWFGKQDEPHASRWRRLLAIKGPLQPVLMIPYWQRRPGGAWQRSSWLSADNVTLDRQRILSLIRSPIAPSVLPPVVWQRLVAD
jgi:hypothetical protein